MAPDAPSSRPLGFTDLPKEIQKDIVGHVSPLPLPLLPEPHFHPLSSPSCLLQLCSVGTGMYIHLINHILSQCQPHDLICLSVVSKHFHDLAAAELYRTFRIVFPDDDDRVYDNPIVGLAGGLDTFVTSDYDYAKHLRDISLDTVSAGEKAETAYKPYLYSLSCGKFLNTLLLLTLRKAKALESLRYEKPVLERLWSLMCAS